MGLGMTTGAILSSDAAPGPLPPPVALTTVNGFPALENVVFGEADITFTLAETSAFAGSHVVDASEQVLIANGPVNEVAPGLNGVSGLGEVLTCDGGLWAFDPDHGSPEYSFQWLRGGISIPGAMGQTYTQVAADSGQELSCLVTASQAIGARSALSAGLVPGQQPGGLLERVGGAFYADNTVSTNANITVDLSPYGAGDTLLVFTGAGEFVADGDMSVDGVAATKISTDPLVCLARATLRFAST